jgi:casein kinase 1
MDCLVARRFQLHYKIGSGSHGQIYLGLDTETNREVALKFERTPSPAPQLHIESQAYSQLLEGVGIPTITWLGRERDYIILVIERLGQSLEDLLTSCRRPFSLKTILMIADQCLTRIEFIHRRLLIHRDIKPSNILIGTAHNLSLLYFIDFGLSKFYRDRGTLLHIPMTHHTDFVGTARFMSVNVMEGSEPSRRDDLISLGYVWVYLFKGALPWQTLELAEGEDRLAAICEKKKKVSLAELCEGMPIEFVRFFETVGRLEFESEPPYAQLRKLFRDLFIRSKFVYDGQWDWTRAAGSEATRPTRLSLSLGTQLEEQHGNRGRRLTAGSRRIVGVGGKGTGMICVPDIVKTSRVGGGRNAGEVI